MQHIANYIDGRLIEPVSGAYLDNVEPATGQVYSRVPDSDERDVDLAASAAAKAFAGWSHTPAAERSRLILRIADLIDRDVEKLARAETIDSGKPIALSRAVDIPRAASNLRFFGTAVLHSHSETHQTETPAPGGAAGARALNYTLRQPRGVAGCISPWNLPLYLFTWKIAPALATGNTVIGKPSEVTPMTAHLLAGLCIEAGLPPGVLNIVHGAGAKAGAALVCHEQVTAISFTGGTATGAAIAREAAPLFKKLSLELGGKNPNIVFADADMEQALSVSVRAAFTNQGQVCLSGSRIFVERSAYDSFLDAFGARASQLTIGDPLEEGVDQGSLVSRAHLEKVAGCLDLAKKEGGTIVCGGAFPDPASLVDPAGRCREGFFLQPTVVTGLPFDCRTNQEEIFGPVVTVAPFDHEDEVIAWANSTPYGLAATVWTENLSRAHRVAEQIQSGVIWINCWLLRDLRTPFGGMKQSGVGREGGEEALRFFTEPKNVCIALRSSWEESIDPR